MKPDKIARRRRYGPALAAGAAAALALALLAVAPAAPASAHAGRHRDEAFRQVNLVSDQPGEAELTDPALVNPWGLAAGPATPLWVADNHTDSATIYRGGVEGQPFAAVPLVVAIPEGAPTGQVFNDTTSFELSDGTPAAFIFDSESGRVTAWNRAQGSTAALVYSSPDGAIYKGLALQHRSHGGPRLLAADFHNAKVDVFDSSFAPVTLKRHAFRDPFLPAGYAPFNLAVIHGLVVVTYAQQDAAAEDDSPGPGRGFVDVYSPTGRLLRHLVRGGVLNSPWGLTIAPRHFGELAGDLLVGNFGDGRIHAFDPYSGRLEATLRSSSGQPIAIEGLWSLMPGNGVAGRPQDVFFSAGPGGEEHGLLGALQATEDR
jgi:uncharacterized protein (TIGR03118 family)